MSFVLEALKMQEAGSDPDAVAARALADIHQRRYRWWVGLAVAATAVNAVVVVWLLGVPWLSNDPAISPTAASPTDTAQSFAATTGIANQLPQAPEAAAPSAAITAPAGIAPGPVVAPGPVASPPAADAPQPVIRVTRLALSDLPSDARRRFPGIAFSTHIYAEDRDLRAIVANGRRLREGDSIRGLGIEEITITGVLLSFEDYLVEVPITTNWDAT